MQLTVSACFECEAAGFESPLTEALTASNLAPGFKIGGEEVLAKSPVFDLLQTSPASQFTIVETPPVLSSIASAFAE